MKKAIIKYSALCAVICAYVSGCADLDLNSALNAGSTVSSIAGQSKGDKVGAAVATAGVAASTVAARNDRQPSRPATASSNAGVAENPVEQRARAERRKYLARKAAEQKAQATTAAAAPVSPANNNKPKTVQDPKLKPFGRSGISLFDESKPLDVRKKAISDYVKDVGNKVDDVAKDLFNASTNLQCKTRDDYLVLLKELLNVAPDKLPYVGKGWWRSLDDELICAAAEAKTPKREEYLELFKIAAIDEKHPERVAVRYAFNTNGKTLPLEARKLALTLIPFELDDQGKRTVFDNFQSLIESTKRGEAKDKDDAMFLSWALVNVKNTRTLLDLLVVPGNDPDKGLTETDYKAIVDRIEYTFANDKIVTYLLGKFSYHSRVPSIYLVEKMVEKISPKNQAIADEILARYSPDIQKAVEALSRSYAADQKKAYDVVFKWCANDYDFWKKTFKNEEDWGKRMSAITDIKLLHGLYCAAKYDAENTQRSGSRDVAPLLYAAIFNNLKTRVDEMDKGKLDNLVSDMIGQSKEIEASKKAVVIGNYYVGMPVLGFIALNKTQDTKALPMEWKMDDEGKHMVISKMAFDSKNIFKAIGLERSEVTMKLPSKLGVPQFEVNVTKTEISRNTSKMNEIAEYLGDYSDSYKVSGGDVYYQSDSEAKGARLIYWKKAGRLDIEML